MDCCNYVQPYAGTGHFYPQHHFFYENNGYGSYGTAPVSNVIQTNEFRYNRLPPAYSTDYVYNPKEARLRKAMREQSREVSRQSILQNTIPSTSESATGNDAIVGSSTSNFSNHPLPCATPVASSLSGSSSINANRIISPWFPVGHAAPTSHLKSILTPRVMAAHQRTIDNTKDVIRKQLECGTTGAFSGVSTPNYTGDFSARNSGQENNDYCIIPEFAEGQKWHPYQNATNPYHVRVAPVTKVGSLHRNVQNSSPHRPSHWPQFCGVALPNPVQSPRQMVFLQEQQSQHCNYSDEMQLRYGPNKADVNPGMHLSYQQDNHQRKEAASLHFPQLQEEAKCEKEGPRWEPSLPPNPNGAKAGCEASAFRHREKPAERAEDRQFSSERVDQKPKSSSKQPLPGFHQAFGSTEIGRFSRSEFFTSMIADNSLSPDAPLSTSASNFPTKFVDQHVPESCCCAKRTEDCKKSQPRARKDCLQLVFRLEESSNFLKPCGLVYNHDRPECCCQDKSPRSQIDYGENEALFKVLDLRLPERKKQSEKNEN